MNKKLARTGPRIRITKSLMRPKPEDGALPSVSDDKRYLYICQNCGRKFTQESDFLRHMSTNHQDHQKPNYTCYICNFMYSKKAIFDNHMQTHHQLKSKSRCDSCSITFKSRYCLRRHLKLKQTLQENACKKCPKKFTSKEHLEKHVRNKHTFKYVIFFCDMCSVNFKFQDSMISHLRRVHGNLCKKA